MLKIKKLAVYPGNGIGMIEKIESKDVQGIKQKYYVLHMEEKKMNVLIPVKNAEDMGLRPLMSPATLTKVFKIFKERAKKKTEKDWKLRYQNNLDKLKSGNYRDLAEMIRDLHKRYKKDELSIMEKKLYDNAINSLTTEISIVKKTEKEKALELIMKSLK